MRSGHARRAEKAFVKRTGGGSIIEPGRGQAIDGRIDNFLTGLAWA
jgi:hypothetical protein